MENSSVSYCSDCICGSTESCQFPDSPRVFENEDEKDEDKEDEDDDDEILNLTNKKKKKNTGRRSLWDHEYIDDMVDIITNSENFKQKLIFTNNKKATNGEVYKLVLKELIKRHHSFPFTIQQMRNKFKWCVSMSRKVALTIQTATGIKRFVEDKGFSKWFDLLFPLIKSRDSCQPERSIEPSTSRPTSSASTSSGSSRRASSTQSDEVENEEEKEEEGAKANLFVPIRKKRKNNESETIGKMLKIMETMVENDPTKDLLKFMKDDAEKSRQTELELLRLIAQGQQPPIPQVPQQTMHQFVQQHQYYQGPPQQYRGQLQAFSPQTTPERNTTRHAPSFLEAEKTYTKL